MNQKKYGAALAAPSQTSTSSQNRHDGYVCQAETEEVAPFTLPVDQIGDRNPPGASASRSVRSLPLEISHSDHKCVQVWRDETHAVYKHFGSYGQFIGWEAIRIKLKKPEVAFGKSYPWREVYPGNEDFGTYALSVGAQYDLEYAISKAKTLKPKTEASVSTNLRRETGKPIWKQDGDVLDLGTNTNLNLNPKLELKAA
jgi:hypothetical protein